MFWLLARAEKAGAGAIVRRGGSGSDGFLNHGQAVTQRCVEAPSQSGGSADLPEFVGSPLAGAFRRSAR